MKLTYTAFEENSIKANQGDINAQIALANHFITLSIESGNESNNDFGDSSDNASDITYNSDSDNEDKNRELAIFWLEKAAGQKHPMVMKTLAIYYAHDDFFIMAKTLFSEVLTMLENTKGKSKFEKEQIKDTKRLIKLVMKDLYDKGMDFYEAGQYREAEVFLKNASELGEPTASYNMGILNIQLHENYQTARAYLHLALTQAHILAEPNKFRAAIHAQLGVLDIEEQGRDEGNAYFAAINFTLATKYGPEMGFENNLDQLFELLEESDVQELKRDINLLELRGGTYIPRDFLLENQGNKEFNKLLLIHLTGSDAFQKASQDTEKDAYSEISNLSDGFSDFSLESSVAETEETQHLYKQVRDKNRESNKALDEQTQAVHSAPEASEIQDTSSEEIAAEDLFSLDNLKKTRLA